MVAVVSLGGAIAVRHCGYPGRQARLQACPSQCLSVHRWRAVRSVLRCLRGPGGLVVVVALGGQGPVAMHSHSGMRQASHSAHNPHHSSQSWVGLRALGPRAVIRCCRGEPHKVDPRNGGNLPGPQEGVHPVPRLGRREGGAGNRRCPVEVGGGDPQEPGALARGFAPCGGRPWSWRVGDVTGYAQQGAARSQIAIR